MPEWSDGLERNGLERMSLDWVPGLDLSTGTFTLPLWAVGVAAAVLVGERIHARAEREVISRLRTSMQHDYER